MSNEWVMFKIKKTIAVTVANLLNLARSSFEMEKRKVFVLEACMKSYMINSSSSRNHFKRRKLSKTNGTIMKRLQALQLLIKHVHSTEKTTNHLPRQTQILWLPPTTLSWNPLKSPLCLVRFWTCCLKPWHISMNEAIGPKITSYVLYYIFTDV